MLHPHLLLALWVYASDFIVLRLAPGTMGFWARLKKQPVYVYFGFGAGLVDWVAVVNAHGMFCRVGCCLVGFGA